MANTTSNKNKKRKSIVILSLILLLTSCASNRNVFLLDKSPTIPQKPYLPIYNLKENSKTPVVMKAYVSSIALLLKWGNAQNLLLKSYSKN